MERLVFNSLKSQRLGIHQGISWLGPQEDLSTLCLGGGEGADMASSCWEIRLNEGVVKTILIYVTMSWKL